MDNNNASNDLQSSPPLPADGASPDIDVAASSAPSSSDIKPAEAKAATAPQPPRWRFVNEAKKSSGYSSMHAGSFIKGKSSNELGAKYTAPDVSIYNQPAREPIIGLKDEVLVGNTTSFTKEDTEVGILSPKNVPPPDVYETDNHTPGKLQIRQVTHDTTPTPTGSFAGLPKPETQGTSTRAPFKEWDTHVTLGPKKERQPDEWYDGKIHDSYTGPKIDAPGVNYSEVNKLGFHRPNEQDNVFTGNVPKGERETIERTVVAGRSFDSYGDPREGALFMHGHDSGSANGRDMGIQTTDEPPSDDRKEKKNRRCLWLLLLLLLLLVIILGVLLGRKNDDAGVVAGAVGGALIPILAGNETNMPSVSLVPSAAPSDYDGGSSLQDLSCPVGTKVFSIEHTSQKRQRVPASKSNSEVNTRGSIWRIKDACSGEVIAQCQPCHSGEKHFSPTSDTAISVVRSQSHGPLHRHLHEGDSRMDASYDNRIEAMECLPLNSEYFFEFSAAEDSSEACCGFDPATSIVSHDNNVIGGLITEQSRTIYFGESETPCDSDKPSSSPTIKGSALPSLTSSHRPSSSPSTSSPTKSPVIFLGGCPETFVQLSYYSLGTQVESNNIVYECISYSCGSYGFEPGSLSSTLWVQGWSVVGSCSGSRAPTMKPSEPPTPSPSDNPTLAPSTSNPTPSPSGNPTVAPSFSNPTFSPSKAPSPRVRTQEPTSRPTTACSTEQDFNICVALDMSGSVCNGGNNSDCLDCKSDDILSTFLPFFFQPECRDSFVDEDTCCSNFKNVKSFGSTMVDLLGDFSADKSFSVVQFANNAQLVSGLSSAGQTSQVIDILQYTGGLTNHAAAINACQRTFPSFGTRKNFILLITDGVPTVPDYDPEGSAEYAASSAKRDGTFLIPVFISPYGNNVSALSYMRRLSSDRQVFDVASFDSLESLEDRLVTQVSCSYAQSFAQNP